MTQLTHNQIAEMRNLFPGVNINKPKLLGGGANSDVYNIGKNRVLKHVIDGTANGSEEVMLQQIAAKKGIAPKILQTYEHNSTEKTGFFIMEKLPPNTITEYEYKSIVGNASNTRKTS
jgi:hypothetical protein